MEAALIWTLGATMMLKVKEILMVTEMEVSIP